MNCEFTQGKYLVTLTTNLKRLNGLLKLLGVIKVCKHIAILHFMG